MADFTIKMENERIFHSQTFSNPHIAFTTITLFTASRFLIAVIPGKFILSLAKEFGISLFCSKLFQNSILNR